MVLIFTRKYGKISAGSSAGEGRGRSKAALAIRPFTYGRYDLFVNRGYYDINSGEVKRSYYSLGEDLDKYMYASFAMELTERILPEEVPQPAMLDLLLGLLSSMEKKKGGCMTTVLAYEIKLLSVLGSMPSLEGCVLCGKKRDPIKEKGRPAAFSAADGGIICGDCLRKKTEENGGGDRLIYTPKFDIVGTMNYLLKKPFSTFDTVALDERVSEELQRIVREYISFYFDVGKLKSEGMIAGRSDVVNRKEEKI